ESPTHLDNLRRLCAALPKGKRLYMADTKRDTPATLLTVAARGGQSLWGGAFAPPLKELFRRHGRKLRRVDYDPKSQAKRPPAQREASRAFELTDRLQGDVDGRAVKLKYRLIFVGGQATARQEAATRERHVAKIRGAFEAVARNRNRYSLKTEEA